MDIAIIGMSGRFPEAVNIQEFYRNLREGRDSVRELSMERKINTTIPPEAEYQVLGYIENIDQFDWKFFNIPRGDAQNMGPQQRLILEVVYETLENAGYSKGFFAGSRTSVFFGDTNIRYYEHAEKFEETMLPGNLNAAVAGRVARFFNLRGSALMIDTACSSSLVAVHCACNELILGEADYAVAGGIELKLFPPLKNAAVDVGIASPDGKSRAFSADAGGTGMGEAVAAVLLKPLDKAVRDKDIIHALIKGSAVNQDAALSGSLTAPDSTAQYEVIRRAWEKANIDPATVTYIEAHGTGTKLGDPIEVQGIDMAFREFTDKKRFCALSSVKTNLGHTNTAAGIVGLIKAVLSLKHKELFPSLHFEKPNRFIDFKNSAAYVITELKKWEVGDIGVRRSGVSSFGLSGTNCHVVLEEAPLEVCGQAAAEDRERRHLITLSAHSEGSLKLNIAALRDFVFQHGEVSLGDLSYTLCRRRQHYRCRFAAVINNREQLLDALGSDDITGKTELEAGKIDKFILAFPDEIAHPKDLVTGLCRDYPVFHSCFESCQRCRQGSGENVNFYRFSFQYCFYELLKSLGITSKFLLGDGLGKIVVAVITGKITLRQGVGEALNYHPTGSADVHQRLRAFLERQAKDTLVFAEMGLAGNISQGLKGLQEDNDCRVITVTQTEVDTLLWYIKDLYLANYPLDWAKLGYWKNNRRVELPTYQFDRERCWIRKPLENYVKEWFYRLVFREEEALPPVPELSGEVFLIFMDEAGLGEEIVHHLGNNGTGFITVFDGDEFEDFGNGALRMCWGEERHYVRLREKIAGLDRELDGVIHLGGVARRDYPLTGSGMADIALSRSLYSQFQLTKTFDELFRSREMRFLVVTGNARLITGDEAALMPEFSTCHGYMASLIMEYPRLRARCVDLDKAEAVSMESLALLVARELAIHDDKAIVGYRKGQRYLPRIEKLAAVADEEDPAALIKEGGVYLVTGGASGLGLEVSRYLGVTHRLKLVVLGRRKLPEKAKWHSLANTIEDDHYRVVEVFKEAERHGSEVQYYSVDLKDREKLAEVIGEVNASYGAINGLVHAAGLPGRKRIRNHTLASFKEALEPKVYGTIHLQELLNPDQLDFVVFFSSQSSLLGAERASNYSAANIFEDHVALQLCRKGVKGISINWPAWRETGMWRRLNEHSRTLQGDTLSISTQEGIQAFMLSLKSGTPNVIVSRQNPARMGENPYFVIPKQFQDNVGSDGFKVKEVEKEREVEESDTIDLNPDWTDVENRLARIWYEVLKIEGVGLEEDFFELGGDSLNGTQVINRIEKEFEIEMEFDELFRYPTIKELAVYIKKAEKTAYLSIEPTEEKEYYALSPAQKRMYIGHQMELGSTTFNMPELIALDEEPDRQLLAAAFQKLIKRHESLRTSFEIINGEVVQRIYDEIEFHLEYYEHTGPADGDGFREVVDNFIKPFDLGQPPLLRAGLIERGEKGCFFMVDMHHIICDAASLTILIQDFQAVLRGEKLPPLRLRYRDYSDWQNSPAIKKRVKEQEAFWLNECDGGMPVLNLATDYARSMEQGVERGEVSFGLAEDVSGQLRELARDGSVTLFVVLLAVYNVLLSKLSRQKDIVVGVVAAGRGHADLAPLIGVFVNMLPLRNYPDGKKSFREFLEESHKRTMAAFENQEYPFENLVERLAGTREPGRQPLHDVGFSFRNFVEQPERIPGDEIKRLRLDNSRYGKKGQKREDLYLEVFETGEQLRLSLEYNKRLFKEETIALYAKYLERIVLAVIENPELKLRMIELIPEEERNRIRSEIQKAQKEMGADFEI
jgi:acyl transferase domain-containing protein/NAD(P)-dependent dehydrogenase (short-subunit alcohol dehydrogenase family)/acyl carrier protein